MGLVKIDLLGIRGLTVLGDVAEFIHASAARASMPARWTCWIRSPRTTRRPPSGCESGRTIGCFQIESPGMRATLREIRARSEDDLMVALALYRPGPLTGGLKDAFVRRFKGEEPVSHLHPALAPLLDETYGVILYQEQVLRIAHELAGLQPGRGRPAAPGDEPFRPRQADADAAAEVRRRGAGAAAACRRRPASGSGR